MEKIIKELEKKMGRKLDKLERAIFKKGYIEGKIKLLEEITSRIKKNETK